MDQDEKVRINRARRAAARQGLALRRTRRRDRRALDYGTYALVAVVPGVADRGEGLTMDDVERALGVPR